MTTLTLKQLLETHNISQRYLADSLDVSSAAINLIINHAQWPKRNSASFKALFIEKLNLLGLDLAAINLALAVAERATTANDGTQNPQQPAHPPASTPEDDLMLLRKQTLTQQAKKQFSLFSNIFTSNIRSADELFNNSDINYVRETLWQAAKGNSTFVAVVGQSGAGKSTLRRELIDRIERERASVVVIEPYVLAAEDNDQKGKTLKSSHIAESILATLAPSVNPKRSPEARFRQIHILLKESSRAGNHHLIIIEEAHSLPIPTLKHLKRFLELENGFNPLLSVLLIGQDELKNKLAENNQEVREVVQRCELITLEPFTQTTLVDYLQHRCRIANRELGEFIDESGLNAISQKLTRNVNRSARNQQTESLLYPLAVGNLLTGALNAAAEVGFPIVTAQVVMEV